MQCMGFYINTDENSALTFLCRATINTYNYMTGKKTFKTLRKRAFWKHNMYFVTYHLSQNLKSLRLNLNH